LKVSGVFSVKAVISTVVLGAQVAYHIESRGSVRRKWQRAGSEELSNAGTIKKGFYRTLIVSGGKLAMFVGMKFYVVCGY